MDDTQLDLGLGILHGNRIREALEAIHACDQDVFQAAVLQLGQDRQPELCPFVLGQPQAQQLLVTLHIDAQCQIERLVDHPLVRADLQHNAVQIDDGIERIQRPVLPFVDLLDDPLGHLRYQPRRDVGVIHLFERVHDVTGAQAPGVEGEDLVVHLGQAGLALADKLRLEGGVTVTRRLDGDLSMLAF